MSGNTVATRKSWWADIAAVGLGPLSWLGLLLGALLFASALTPTLVPRDLLPQGVLAGLCFFIGYALGVFLTWLWTDLEPPQPNRAQALMRYPAAAISLAFVVISLWRSTNWQNSVRAAVGMPEVDSMNPFLIVGVAVLTFVLLLALGRLAKVLATILYGLMRRHIPQRVAMVLAISVTALLFWSIANGVLARTAFEVLDASYRQYDALLEPERPQPLENGRTGNPGSLVAWNELGRAGREFVSSGPHASDISAVTGRPALEPIRVYVGQQSESTPQDRARLALKELKRQGGFSRSLLIVITPTGTGWIDPAAMDPVEYLHDGDIASVAVQYSYLSSPLSLLAQSEYGAETARALFSQIYGYWTTLPKDKRPRLYLHGLSLGAMNSQQSARLFEMMDDPIQGALWSGTPFVSPTWRTVTQERNAGSLARLPQFRDGRMIRFMNQNGFPQQQTSRPWGPIRIVYLQYASDPIVFFNVNDFYKAPDWMREPLAPDVSPQLRWYPIITGFQLILDMLVANKTPMGFGHVYAPQHYIDAWVAVTDVKGWSEAQLAALKKRFETPELAGSTSTKQTPQQSYEGRGG
ncbi:alpha/beta-hydrolase family protein [Rhizobium calliandrae]|uniref:Alpha/beta-hydrolase family protein n=1 Tax=Rhizobium calliandrae TaxID=1312182 RepID=A0ABT7KMJ4_9HYPH|nr:alpha/beta-hydrolase family protein [Rhizobium calliandrae]MDL2409858.1 alpha/beta-hydrolase family protein [Rhizobium calliandrae]